MNPSVPGPRPHLPSQGLLTSAWIPSEPSAYPSCRLETHGPTRGWTSPSWEDLLGRR